jgi:hypothetical protein
LCYDESDETGKRKTPVFILRFSNDCDNDLADSIYDIGKVIDVASFKRSEDGFYRDKFNKYEFISFADGGHLSIIENDSSTYKEIGKGFYKGADGRTYIRTQSMTKPPPDEKWENYYFRKVPDIDVVTYDDYGQIDGYAKDKNHVYFRRGTTDGDFIDLVEGADPVSFTFKGLNKGYAWDKNHVYLNGTLQEGINRDSLISVESK